MAQGELGLPAFHASDSSCSELTPPPDRSDSSPRVSCWMDSSNIIYNII